MEIKFSLGCGTNAKYSTIIKRHTPYVWSMTIDHDLSILGTCYLLMFKDFYVKLNH